MTTPTLASLAAPKGKGEASVPWGGPAGLMTTPALAAPKGEHQSLGTARRD